MKRLAKQDKPFFLAAGFVRPHLPFVVPRKYWELYDANAIPLAANPFLPKHSPAFAINTMYELRDYFDFDGTPRPSQGSLAETQQRRLKHGYYASVSFIDSLIGQLLAELESLGLADNTIVVLWGDHGWKLGEHNSWCKQTNYEIDARVPLIIRVPNTTGTGRNTDALVELLDVYPTLCELAGLPPAKRSQGRSMAPLLSNPGQPWKQAAFSQFRRQDGDVPLMGYAMRTDRYRYVEWQDRRTRDVVATELYDHETDPLENTNLSGESENANKLAELSRLMWATLPTPPKYEVKKQRQPAAIKQQSTSAGQNTLPRPNIVFCMADDWSWPHAGILGDPVVKTPSFDRIAREGVLFENAFVSTPSCTPSRLSILTGQHHWRLKEGDSLGGSLREEFDVYTEMLQQAGYRIGRFGKGVWPSEHTFRKRDSFGEKFRNFEEFIKDRKTNEPFCYWHGGQDPHRPYELGIGAHSGIDVSKVKVPACLPDNETVRSDVADYLWEVQRFDHEVGEIVAKLEAIGELDNTIIVVSGDNGMPFPRCKATLYDQGTRVPLAVRWGAKWKGNRRLDDFVSLCDLAPTFLEAAGVMIPQQMTGRSLMSILASEQSGQIDSSRSFVLTGVERHVYSYPKRALRNSDFLYVRNFNPDEWPTGETNGGTEKYNFAETPWPTEPGAFSYAIDPSPSKQFLRLNRNQSESRPYADLSFARRPAEELYDLRKDPDQLNNVADDREYVETRRQLRRQLDAELIKSGDPRLDVPGYSSRDVEGWPVRVSDELMSEEPQQTTHALQLLAEQLREVKRVVPGQALAQIRTVPIWLSPPYDGSRPTGEYHPGAAWLKDHGRLPELHRCVEFTNTAIFDREIKRMPVMVLHELAHAYHEQVLGYDNDEVQAAYERARDNGTYNAVSRGNGKTERAYAMTNPMEYFAELSEALLGRNDFFPFDRQQLGRHDPQGHKLLVRLWGLEQAGTRENETSEYRVEKPPAALQLPPFYRKYVDANGYPIVSSGKVSDFALKEAAYLIDMMLAERPDIRRAMVASGSRMIVMSHDEFTTDIPEHSQLRPKDYWDARARGLGGSRNEAVCSCGEENLLGFDGDPYSTENILIHEFAHNIHYRGMVNLDPSFDDRLKQTYERAMAQGLWQGKYASTNHAEYFAEGVQSWFNNNRQPDHDHNHVDTRKELREYDAGLASICEEVFGETKLVYSKPITRLEGHLAGYDPSKSPRFDWPERLRKSKQAIRDEVKKQGTDRKQEYKN